MLIRNIYAQLLNHLPKKQVTAITGMRRVGKSRTTKQKIAYSARNLY